MINKIKESSQFIKNEFPSEIHSAIILGSGMGCLLYTSDAADE